MTCCAVIDTNVLVSALLSPTDDAATVQVFTRMLSGEILPVYSKTIIEEYRTVLRRERFGFSSERVDALDDAIAQLKNGCEKDLTQDHAQASGAPKIKKEEGLIDFSLSAQTIHDRIRAFNPWPGGYGKLGGRMVYLRKTDVVGVGACKAEGSIASAIAKLSPGVVEFKDNRFFVGTGDGVLEVIEIQAEGKKPMPVADFMRGIQKREGLQFC